MMASMGTNLADREGFVTDEMVCYYAERAKGGVGLIMTELVTIIFPGGNGIERQLSINDNKCIPGLKRLVEQVHQYGAKIFAQLNHAGHRAKPEFTGGAIPVSASDVPSSIVKAMPKPLSVEEIHHLVDSFAKGARRAAEAGFDGIDLHFAHGYLLCQFLSPFTNKRSDEYGGGLENRARFALEILKRCRLETGEGFPITGKVTGKQYLEGGISLSETKVFCRLLEKSGIDAIQVSGGDPESIDHFPVPPMYNKRGCYVNLAESIKRVINIPVIAVGRVNHLELANHIIEKGKADLVAMGRAFLVDPYFPKKGQEGKLEDIRICIGCNQGCRGRDRTRDLAVGCILNPRAGKEMNETEITPASVPKNIFVIGGGPGGMEAARVAALRGHRVTLIEEKKRLGGQLRMAAKPPGRGEFRHLIDWYRTQMVKLGVNLLLGSKATPDLIVNLKPNTVILATGSRPLFPEIEGLGQTRVVHAYDILEKRIQVGQRVVIIGGGGVGLETADFLASRGREVTVVEQLVEVGRDLEPSTKKVLMGRLGKNRVKIITSAFMERIEKEKISIRWGEEKKEIYFDEPLVIAVGVEPNRELYHSLKDNQYLKNIDIFAIGDSVSPRQLREAISEAYTISKNL